MCKKRILIFIKYVLVVYLSLSVLLCNIVGSMAIKGINNPVGIIVDEYPVSFIFLNKFIMVFVWIVIPLMVVPLGILGWADIFKRMDKRE
jgi:hypothetical protein